MSSLPTSPDAKVNTSGGDRRAQERGRALVRVTTDTALGQARVLSAPSSVSLPMKWVFGLQPIRPLLVLTSLCFVPEENVGIPETVIDLICFISQVHGDL